MIYYTHEKNEVILESIAKFFSEVECGLQESKAHNIAAKPPQSVTSETC